MENEKNMNLVEYEKAKKCSICGKPCEYSCAPCQVPICTDNTECFSEHRKTEEHKKAAELYWSEQDIQGYFTNRKGDETVRAMLKRSVKLAVFELYCDFLQLEKKVGEMHEEQQRHMKDINLLKEEVRSLQKQIYDLRSKVR